MRARNVYVPAELGVKVMDFGEVGLVLAPRPPVHPLGLLALPSILSSSRVSPLPAAKVAVMVLDWPIFTVEPSDEVMVADGDVGAETLSVAEQENALPLCPMPEPL